MQQSVQDVSVANAEQLLARFERERHEVLAQGGAGVSRVCNPVPARALDLALWRQIFVFLGQRLDR